MKFNTAFFLTKNSGMWNEYHYPESVFSAAMEWILSENDIGKIFFSKS